MTVTEKYDKIVRQIEELEDTLHEMGHLHQSVSPFKMMERYVAEVSAALEKIVDIMDVTEGD